MKSFSDARNAFKTNFAALLSQFNYTPTIFSMRLNQAAFAAGSTKHVASAEDVAAWISGSKIPSLYAFYKVCGFFNVSMDAFLSNEPISVSSVSGKSFAKHTPASPKVKSTITTQDTTTNTQEEPKMANKTTKKSTNNTNAKMRELIRTRTDSTEYNLNLASRILTSDMQLKDIADKVGVSTRSLRDYMYYNTSMSSEVAKALAAVLRTNTTALGLRMNKETSRYESVK